MGSRFAPSPSRSRAPWKCSPTSRVRPVTMSSVAAPIRQDRLITALGKAGAIFKRDQRLATSYDMAFTIQWLQIIIQIISFYFIATLIGRGQHFGLLGGAIPYFSYVVVNLAFARFQM